MYVYTVTNDRNHPGLARLRRSVHRAGGYLRIIVRTERIGRTPIGSGAKIIGFYEAIRTERKPTDLVMFVDAFDVLLRAPLEELAHAFHGMGADIVFSAEEYCWPTEPPYEAFCSRFLPVVGYGYLNSGMYMGTCVAVQKLIADHRSTLHAGVDDQAWFGDIFLREPERIKLDTKRALFQNLIDHGAADIVWDAGRGRWRNERTGTYPMVWHGPPVPAVYVYTVTNDWDHPGLAQLRRSVHRAGGCLRIIMRTEQIGRTPIGYGAKILGFYEAICSGRKPTDLVMFVDAFDVLFGASLEELAHAFHGMGADIVFSAEEYCWPTEPPYESYCSRFPPMAGYGYLNSGMYMGTCAAVQKLIADHRSTLHAGVDDQAWFGYIFLREPERIKLDTQCVLFQNLIAHGATDIVWDAGRGRWRNERTGTYPMVWHGNGPLESRLFLFDVIGKNLW